MGDLFRKEAMEAHSQGTAQYGCATGVVPPAWSRITGLLALFMAALFVFLFTVDVARKETVRGQLRPVSGEARIYAQEAGTVDAVFVEEGQLVAVGEPLMDIVSDRYLSDGGRLSESAIAGIDAEIESLQAQRGAIEVAAGLDRQSIEQRRHAADRQARDAAAQLAVIDDRLVHARNRVDDGADLLREGLIVEGDFHQRFDTVLQLETLRLQTEGRMAEAEGTKRLLIVERRQIATNLKQELSAIDQRLTQLRGQRRQAEAGAAHRIVASMSGRVTALQARQGETVDLSRPLLNLVPPEAELIAELYLPSRAIAFVEPGQQVKVQYDAFPYQKFGVAEATILRVSSTTLFPQELGIASQTPDPLYRVEARLAAQTMVAFNQDIPLQSGMQLTADIVLENRKLLDWFLEPLRSVR